MWLEILSLCQLLLGKNYLKPVLFIEGKQLPHSIMYKQGMITLQSIIPWYHKQGIIDLTRIYNSLV